MQHDRCLSGLSLSFLKIHQTGENRDIGRETGLADEEKAKSIDPSLGENKLKINAPDPETLAFDRIHLSSFYQK